MSYDTPQVKFMNAIVEFKYLHLIFARKNPHYIDDFETSKFLLIKTLLAKLFRINAMTLMNTFN